MSSLVVCDRTRKEKSSRIRFNPVNLKGNVVDLKEQLSKSSSVPINSIELVYCGKVLKDRSSLESCGIKSGATIHAILATGSLKEDKPEPLEEGTIKHVISTLQTALLNPAYRSTVDSLMNSPEELRQIISAIPGLDSDPGALSVLQDQDLLCILAHPGNIRRVLQVHPAFGSAALAVAAAVTEAGAKDEGIRMSTGAYSLDQMSDDEDNPMPVRGSGQARTITASQLAAALAAATSPPQPGPSRVAPPVISSDFFQQAIMQAQSAAMQTQIQQMREMGITDENVARQALQATNGDLQAAIDLIFAGNL